MAAALLLPVDSDDRAPPIACRTRERRSQGYSKILVLVLAVCVFISSNETCPIRVSRLKTWLGDKKNNRGTYDENPIIKLW